MPWKWEFAFTLLLLYYWFSHLGDAVSDERALNIQPTDLMHLFLYINWCLRAFTFRFKDKETSRQFSGYFIFHFTRLTRQGSLLLGYNQAGVTNMMFYLGIWPDVPLHFHYPSFQLNSALMFKIPKPNSVWRGSSDEFPKSSCEYNYTNSVEVSVTGSINLLCSFLQVLMGLVGGTSRTPSLPNILTALPTPSPVRSSTHAKIRTTAAQ